MAVRSFWTKSAKCRSRCRQSCCAFCKARNISVLEPAMLRASILVAGRPSIDRSDLPEHIAHPERAGASYMAEVASSSNGVMKSLDDVEREYIAHVMAHTPSLEEAARALKID